MNTPCQGPSPGTAGTVCQSTPGVTPQPESLDAGSRRHPNKNKRQMAMFRQPKFRQAGLIVFATTVILILPNLTRLVS